MLSERKLEVKHRYQNSEKGKKTGRAYYLRNKDKSAARAKAWREANADRNRDNRKRYMRALRLTPAGKTIELWNAARRRAIKRDIEFTLTKEWILKRLERGVCEVSGLPFEYAMMGEKVTVGMPRSPSLDRIDSKRGYTPNNTRVVVWQVNLALADHGDDAFLEMCRAVVEKEKRCAENSRPKKSKQVASRKSEKVSSATVHTLVPLAR